MRKGEFDQMQPLRLWEYGLDDLGNFGRDWHVDIWDSKRRLWFSEISYTGRWEYQNREDGGRETIKILLIKGKTKKSLVRKIQEQKEHFGKSDH